MTARADVESLLLAHQVSPGQSVAVRLLGTVGPDGSWALDHVLVRLMRGRVVIVPRVRHSPGRTTVPTAMRLDRTIHLLLPPGPNVVEVQGREGTLRETVLVTHGARRVFPRTEIHVHEPVPGEGVVPIELVGTTTDGFVARLEWRTVTLSRNRGASAPPAGWREANSARAEGACCRAWLELRPGEARRIEARAVDGQGTADPAPAVMDLP